MASVYLTLSFEGLRLKGYCAAHPCPPEGGPSEIELNCIGEGEEVEVGSE